MTAILAVILALCGGVAALLGLRHRRPALFFLGCAVGLTHALPLGLSDPGALPATLNAFWTEAVLIAALASCGWLVGYWLFARNHQPLASSAASGPAQNPQTGHVLIFSILLALIALSPGGPLGFAQAGFLRLPVETTLFSLTYTMACLGAFSTALVCIYRLSAGGPAPWLSIGLILMVFWFLGGRTQLAITGLSFALIYLAQGKVALHRLALPGAVLALLAVLTLSFRLNLQGQSTDILGAIRMTFGQMSLLESYAFSARYAAETGVHPGHYADVLQQLFPRAVFPEKPMQLSRALRLMEARDMLGGLTPGLAGEAFAAGGFACLAAISLAFGSVLAILDNAYKRLGSLTPAGQALVAGLIPLLSIFALRGGLDTAIFRLAILLLAAGLFGLWRMRSPATASPAPL